MELKYVSKVYKYNMIFCILFCILGLMDMPKLNVSVLYNVCIFVHLEHELI